MPFVQLLKNRINNLWLALNEKWNNLIITAHTVVELSNEIGKETAKRILEKKDKDKV